MTVCLRTLPFKGLGPKFVFFKNCYNSNIFINSVSGWDNMIPLCFIILKKFCVNNSKGICWLIHRKIQEMCVVKVMFDDELRFLQWFIH